MAGELSLRLDRVVAGYNNSAVLHEVTLELPRDEIVAILGPNGAGKTTLLRSIVGLLRPLKGGDIWLDGVGSIAHMPAFKLVRHGVTLVPEGRAIIPGLTVQENLRMGGYIARSHKVLKQRMTRVFGLFPRLEERQDQVATTLSGGEQQMLAIGRGLMSDPRVLLLDEPSLGLAPILVESILGYIEQIHAQGVAIILVEQNAHAALDIADRAYVLEHGHVVLEGTATELKASEHLARAYFGFGRA